jgi:hypothetical protein
MARVTLIAVVASLVAATCCSCAVNAQEDKYWHKSRLVTFASKEAAFFSRELLLVWKGALCLLQNDRSGDEDRRSWDVFENRFEESTKPRVCQVKQAFGDELYLGYDLTGKDLRPTLVKDLKDPATQWTRTPVKGGGFYLSPANGPLKGYYLDFEKPEKDSLREPGTRKDVTVHISRAIISKAPGERSRLTRMPASPRD